VGLSRFNVRVLTRTSVKRVDAGKVTVQAKSEEARGIRSDLTFWCAGVRGRALPPLSMRVEWTLQSVERPDVFVVGDCARFPEPVPQLAQTAEQEALVAAHNVLHPGAMRRFEPKIKGTILSLGPGYAVAELANGSVLTGKLPWHVKKQYYKWNLRRG
jgi:NADH dehydrogenase